MRPPGRPAAAQLDEDGLLPALYDDRLTRCAKTTGGGSPMCCRVSPPATFELSGSGKADDGSTGAIHESAAAVGAEAGLDGAVAGESFGTTARGFQQSAANVIVREGVRFAGAGPSKQPIKGVQVIERRHGAQESSLVFIRWNDVRPVHVQDVMGPVRVQIAVLLADIVDNANKLHVGLGGVLVIERSEERRVGKEGRSRW